MVVVVINFDDNFVAHILLLQIKEKTERSYPMNAHDQMRFNATTDYSGFSDHGGADSSGFKSRPRSRLTICEFFQCFVLFKFLF